MQDENSDRINNIMSDKGWNADLNDHILHQEVCVKYQ